MKKMLSLMLCAVLVLGFSACSDKKTQSETTASQNASWNGMREKLDQMEYVMYQAVFFEDKAADYTEKEYTKDGVFAVLRDEYNSRDRYYVWGYADNTKCCDYQWELQLPENTEIPESGSYVSVTGTLRYNEGALDKYQLEDVTLSVQEKFENAGFDYDLSTLSPILCRVQIINMQGHPDKFAGKTLRVFGRALTTESIQHPYYDEAWSLSFTPLVGQEIAIGDNIVLCGMFKTTEQGCTVETYSLQKA